MDKGYIKKKEEAQQKHIQDKITETKVRWDGTDIAIIGLACRFPGAKNYREFADNLLKGINSIQEIPPSRWDIKKYYSSDFNEPNKSISKWCGLIDHIDQFDNQFFNISPREANNMDPQQRLLLEETWHCLEDSGVSLANLQQKITSVYVGVMAIDYHQEASAPDVLTDSYACLGNYECILANRLSYVFGLQGASISIDAACASSLVALHEARRTLIMKECDYSLAAGVSLNFHPWKYISFSKSRMLSPDGQCKTFDIGANGYVPGEGVGVILLQRLEEAIADGNHIYGIIKGSAVNHGGKTASITAPRVEAQQKVILSAYKSAGINPNTLTYVEAHGTGTSLGDPIEIESITKAFREYTQDKQFCRIGSVKTNIGHLEAAAGIAGVTKVLKMIHYRKIFKSLHIKKLNPIINFKDSPFMVATEIGDWEPREPGLPLRAGVSSFGFGGVNAHVVLEEYPQDQSRQASEPAANQLFLLSAKSSNSLSHLLEEWRQFIDLESFSLLSLKDICPTLKLGRGSFPYRFGGHIRSQEDLKELLHQELPSIPKQEKKNWCWRIGDFSFDSLEQFKAYLGRFGLFKENLEKVEKCLLELKDGQWASQDFYQGTWSESTKPLYSFMIAYAGVVTLIDLGFSPEVITGEKAGVLVGLVLSGIMKLEDALAILIKQKEVPEIEFTRPKIPYYDSILRTTVMPFHFDKNYLCLLVDELGRQNKLLGQILVDGILYAQRKDHQQPREDHQSETWLGQLLIHNGVITKNQLENALKKQAKGEELLGAILVREKYCTTDSLTETLHQQDILRYYVLEVFHYYVDKARLLNANQFTFKKYLEEWNEILKKSGRDLLQLLYDDQLLSSKGGRLRNEKLLLMIMIMSSLRWLNEKWNLTEQQLVDEKRFYELVDLVTDGVMPKEDLVELLLNDKPDYTAIAHTLNKRQINRNLNNSYRYIKKLNPHVREIEDISSWLIKAMEIKNLLPEDSLAYLPIHNIAFFEIGLFNEPVPFQGAVHLKIAKDLCELFTDSLLQLWLQGVDIHWEKLYEEGSYKKVVLPVYPFDRKSFWLPRKDNSPKVGERLGLGYQRSFSLKDPIIQDHIITGHPLIPGASLIELGLEAAQKATQKPIHLLHNILIQNPGLVKKEEALEITINPQEKQFAIRKDTAVLCFGKYETGEVEPFSAFDLSGYIKKQSQDMASVYQLLSRVGYQYGKGLQVIEGLWRNDHGFLFQLKKLPKETGQITSLNPRILDGIFQTALAAAYLKGLLIEDHTLYVPYYLKSLTIARDLDDLGFVFIDTQKDQQDILLKGHDLNAQLRVYNASGEMVVWIQDMLFKHVPNQFLMDSSQVLIDSSQVLMDSSQVLKDSCQVLMDSSQVLDPSSQGPAENPLASPQVYFYKPCFIRQSIPTDLDRLAPQPKVIHPVPQPKFIHLAPQPKAVLFINENEVSNQLSQKAALYYQKVFSISSGAAFLNKGNNQKGNSHFEINPHQEQDYLDLIQHLNSQLNEAEGQYDIYFLWADELKATPIAHLQDLKEKQEQSLKSLFFLIKALTRVKSKNVVRVMVCTHDVQVIELPDKGNGYALGGLWGLAKTAMMENPKLKIKLIDFDNHLSFSEQIDCSLQEAFSSDSAEFIAYRHKERYLRTFEPCSIAENHQKPIFKDNGVYLLIGGAGGIGMKVAEMITKQVKANLILVGRSALDSEKRPRLEQLRSSNCEILYVQADVTSQEHMNKLLQIIKTRYGALHGVIQAGGVLEDRLLVSKDWASFQRVMASKVYGTWILNHLTQTEPLDFFVVFSSIVSMVGNIGQIDYAAANSYLDSFIQYRSQNKYPGKSLCINWTLWADGGMGVSEQVKKNFKTRGLTTISSHLGLKALGQIMQQEQPCELAVLGQKDAKFLFPLRP